MSFLFCSWAPTLTGMGKGTIAPSGHVVEVFLYIVKCSVDELFMRYFYNLSSASRSVAPDPTGVPSMESGVWTPALGDFHPQTANLPTPRKNHAGFHGFVHLLFYILFFCCVIKQKCILLNNKF